MEYSCKNQASESSEKFLIISDTMCLTAYRTSSSITYIPPVPSILLYGSQALFADISRLEILENCYWKDIRRCYGRNDYNTLNRTSNNAPICYQLIERDLRFFISIYLGNTCMKFKDFFSMKTNCKLFRTNSHDHIVVSPTKKQLTAKSFLSG